MAFLLSNLSYLDLDGEFDMDVSDVVSFKGLIHFLMGSFECEIPPGSSYICGRGEICTNQFKFIKKL